MCCDALYVCVPAVVVVAHFVVVCPLTNARRSADTNQTHAHTHWQEKAGCELSRAAFFVCVLLLLNAFASHACTPSISANVPSVAAADDDATTRAAIVCFVVLWVDDDGSRERRTRPALGHKCACIRHVERGVLRSLASRIPAV